MPRYHIIPSTAGVTSVMNNTVWVFVLGHWRSCLFVQLHNEWAGRRSERQGREHVWGTLGEPQVLANPQGVSTGGYPGWALIRKGRHPQPPTFQATVKSLLLQIHTYSSSRNRPTHGPQVPSIGKDMEGLIRERCGSGTGHLPCQTCQVLVWHIG